MKKIFYLCFLMLAAFSISGCASPSNQVEQPATISQEAKLVIDGQEYILDNNLISSTSAYDILVSITAQNNIELQTKQYDFGLLVEAIGDKVNGQDNKYWLYYVNGEMPMVSVDNYEINLGDKIEFKFELSTF
ncbi:MAG: DUF4430 domain-containing protein [Candidatus Kuenenbacteria bacterium]